MSNGPRTIRRKPTDPKVRAEELAIQGMPFQLAMAVALGKVSLNEALERMARNDRVARIEQEHAIEHALAVQVALGHANLDDVLAKRRLDEHRKKFREHTRLEPGAAAALGLHGARLLKGTIAEVGRYSITLHPEKGEPEEVHKLQVKFLYSPADWKRARKAIKVDKNVAALNLQPQPRPQDRYGCSDKRLFRYLDRRDDVGFTLLDGDVISGVPSWFSQYEVGVRVRGDIEIVVFRHAFHHVGR